MTGFSSARLLKRRLLCTPGQQAAVQPLPTAAFSVESFPAEYFGLCLNQIQDVYK